MILFLFFTLSLVFFLLFIHSVIVYSLPCCFHIEESRIPCWAAETGSTILFSSILLGSKKINLSYSIISSVFTKQLAFAVAELPKVFHARAWLMLMFLRESAVLKARAYWLPLEFELPNDHLFCFFISKMMLSSLFSYSSFRIWIHWRFPERGVWISNMFGAPQASF